MNEKKLQDSTKLAGRVYNSSDYHSDESIANGLAVTHEQFSDSYMEGEIAAVIDNIAEKDMPIPRKGYSQPD